MLYVIKPQLLHRFVGALCLRLSHAPLPHAPRTCALPRSCTPISSVRASPGYLEETAVHTYTNIVNMTKTPGTKLHTAWKDTPAPQVAINYWQLPSDAMWVDCLKRMLADESHHRDVNHAMASMSMEQMFGQDNPFVREHQEDYEAAVKRHTEAVLKRTLRDLDLHKTQSSDALA